MKTAWTLDCDDVITCSIAGTTRTLAAIQAGFIEPYGSVAGDRTRNDIQSVCAEMCVARLLGIDYEPQLTPDYSGDVGGFYEVRSTSYGSGHLICHLRDNDERPYILVTGRAPTFTVRGWVWGWEAKSERYRRTTSRNELEFWVPQRCLWSWSSLPEREAVA